MEKLGSQPNECACSCGHAEFRVRAAPLFRFLCHCTLCQRFNDAAFADVVVYRAADLEDPPNGSVEFETLRPPPNVQRGRCAKCGNPAVEKFLPPLLPKLKMVPRSMHGPDAQLPAPVAHMFYDTRVTEAEDELPKYQGYLKSQLAFGKYLVAARLSRKQALS